MHPDLALFGIISIFAVLSLFGAVSAPLDPHKTPRFFESCLTRNDLIRVFTDFQLFLPSRLCLALPAGLTAPRTTRRECSVGPS